MTTVVAMTQFRIILVYRDWRTSCIDVIDLCVPIKAARRTV